MSALAFEAQQTLRFLAEPIQAGDKVKSQIARAARATGLSYWRAFDLWYRKARAIRAEEIEAIREARAKRGRSARDELQEIETAIASLAAVASRFDAQGLSEQAHQIRKSAGQVRRALAQGR